VLCRKVMQASTRAGRYHPQHAAWAEQSCTIFIAQAERLASLRVYDPRLSDPLARTMLSAEQGHVGTGNHR
jgi:hypothetical protein